MSDDLEPLKRELGDRYRLERVLGRGGMATVYLARDLKHDRAVAIKVLKPELSAAVNRERFLLEIRLTAGLDHPHILALLDSGVAAGLLYYVTPFVAGESLRDRLARERQLPIRDVVRIAREVADALEHAHGMGIIHRDIKPENILLSGGHARVADFGIARLLAAESETLTGTGLAVGTKRYMSPEQASAERHVDQRTDVFSLGCVAYEMLSGEPPSPQAVFGPRSNRAPPLGIRLIRTTLPEAAERVILKALAPVPADRFATAKEFGDALSAAASSIDVPRSSAPILSRRALVGVGVLTVLSVAVGGWWATRDSSAVLPRIDSLAVLPFENLSRDSSQQYLLDGMHEAVTVALGELNAFRVTSRTSTLRYRDGMESLPRIAADLDVAYLVEGSVAFQDSAVRVTVRLVDGRRDRQLLSRTYDGSVTDAFALQSEVAAAVARELTATSDASVKQRLATLIGRARARTPDPAAHRAYIKGRYYMHQAPGRADLAIREFRRAIDIDPDFALAHAALAEAAWWLGSHQPEFRPQLGVAALNAVQRDPSLAEAQVALGLAKMNEWDWEESDAAFRRALDLNPNSATAHQWYAQLLRQTERLDEAMEHIETAGKLDPNSLPVRAMVGWVLLTGRRYDEALAVWDETLELDPEFGLAIFNKGLAYRMKGMGANVIAAAERAKSVERPIREPLGDWLLANGYALDGQHDRARALLRMLETRAPRTNPELIASVYLALGERERALDFLEQGFVERSPALPNMISEPYWDSLRDEPRFKAVRKGVGLR